MDTSIIIAKILFLAWEDFLNHCVRSFHFNLKLSSFPRHSHDWRVWRIFNITHLSFQRRYKHFISASFAKDKESSSGISSTMHESALCDNFYITFSENKSATWKNFPNFLFRKNGIKAPKNIFFTIFENL